MRFDQRRDLRRGQALQALTVFRGTLRLDPTYLPASEGLVAAAPSADAYRGLVYSYRMAGRDEDAARVTAAAHERFPDDTFFAPEAGEQDHQ